MNEISRQSENKVDHNSQKPNQSDRPVECSAGHGLTAHPNQNLSEVPEMQQLQQLAERSKALVIGENLRLKEENRELKIQIENLQPKYPTPDIEQDIQKTILTIPLQDLRRIATKDLHPKDLRRAEVIIRTLVSRIESQEQAISALNSEKTSEKEISEIHSQMNTLKMQVIKVETERNTLSEALRIVSSQGRIDPVKEGQLAAREEINDQQWRQS